MMKMKGMMMMVVMTMMDIFDYSEQHLINSTSVIFKVISYCKLSSYPKRKSFVTHLYLVQLTIIAEVMGYYYVEIKII